LGTGYEQINIGGSRGMTQRYTMDYIPDKTVYKAVMFARQMMRNGTPPPIANSRAAKYYGISSSDVAHYTGQNANRIKTIKKNIKSK
jgi:hypothetical protein